MNGQENNMKKLIAVLLAALLLIGCLTACAPKETPDSGKKPEPQESDKKDTKAPEDEVMEIRWMVYNESGVLPDKNLRVKEILEEKYNIKITIEQVDANSTESLGLYWASGGDPDVVTYTYATAQTVPDLVENNYLRSIPSGWLDTYMPDWMQIVYDSSALDKEGVLAQVSIGGDQYVVPRNDMLNDGYLMVIRQDWLDNLGLSVPTNLQELHDVMYAFTYNDPDGNGIDDTYGLHGKNTYFGFGYIANVLGAVNCAYELQDDGTVVHSNTQESMKNFLKLAHEWYAEGIIDPDFPSENQDIMIDKWNNGKIGIVVHDLAYFTPSYPSNLIDSLKTVNPDARATIIDPFPNENGEVYLTALPDDSSLYGSIMFGNNCTDEKMQMVMRIKNDLVKDWDFYKRVYYGEEGIDYEIVDGVIQPIKKDQVDYKSGYGASFAVVPIATEHFTEIYDKESAEIYQKYGTLKTLKVIRNFSLMQGCESFDMWGADVETLCDEFWYGSIRGDIDIDAEWDAYVQSLYDVGLQQILDEYEELLRVK